MKDQTLADIKNDYGETVLNCALINLFQNGKRSFDRTTLREQIANLTEIYDELDKKNQVPIISHDFAVQVLNCEYKLIDFDDMTLLTYLSNNKKEDN